MRKAPVETAGRWFLLTLGLSCVTLLASVFSIWELVEHTYFRHVDYVLLHRLYITRGVMSSILVGIWAAWFVLRERRRHEEQLEDSCAFYRTILDHMPEAVVLFDEQFLVVDWNEAADRLYGMKRTAVLGRRLPTVPAKRWVQMEEVLALLARDQQVLDKETERCTAKGEYIPVAASYACIPPVGTQPRLFAEVAQDIRPRLLYRDRLLEVEKLALMGQIAAGTAHHLNTPLTTMLLQIELLRRPGTPGGENGDELSALEKRIRFCQVFVQNLLRFARRPQMHKKPTLLGDTIQAATTLFRPSLSLKKASLSVNTDDIAPCQVLGDPNYLEVMFSALVSNAVDAIPIGGWIRITGCCIEGPRAEVNIDDSGAGIPEEQWHRIFEPFFTTKPAGQGTGLGLSIARNVAEQHGGTLELHRLLDAGVRATVRLPLLQVPVALAAGLKEGEV